MSYLWSKTKKWKAMCEEEYCPVCQNSPQPSEFVTIQETESTWIEAHPRVALRGTCYIMAKKHAVELFDLSDDEALTFLKEVMRVAKAVKEVTGAIKINYEIHGNTVPHLHMHIFPRYLDDRFQDGPINPRDTEPPVYEDGEFDKFIQDMRVALS